MLETREANLQVVTGMMAVGKSYTTLNKIIAEYISGIEPRKVLIYDVNMEYAQFKTIALKDVKRFTMQKQVEVRRVVPRLEDGTIANIDQMMLILNEILVSFAGGLLLLEDINKYMIGTQNKEIISSLCTVRHKDLDIIIHLQSLSAVTTRMFQNCKVIRFHKQEDPIDRYFDRIPNTEILKIAQILVDTQYENGNTRFYCYVSSQDRYIRGMFSKAAFKQACEKYTIRYSPELKFYLKEMGKGGEVRQKAINRVVDELVVKYYR